MIYKIKRGRGKPRADEKYQTISSKKVTPEGFKFYKISKGKLLFKRINKGSDEKEVKKSEKFAQERD